MERTIKEIEECKLLCTYTFSYIEFDKKVRVRFGMHKHNLEVEGYEKGKVTFNQYLEHFGVEVVYKDSIELLLKESIMSTIKEYNLLLCFDPIYTIDYDKVKMYEDLSIEVTLVLFPQVELGNYKDININLKAPAFDEEYVKKTAFTEFSDQLSYVESECVTSDSLVSISYEAVIDDNTFTALTMDNVVINMSEDKLLLDFKDQLLSKKVNDSFLVIKKYSNEYFISELKGKTVTYKVVINYVKQVIIPQINDQFVKTLEIPNVFTIKDFNNYIYSKSKESYSIEQQDLITDAALNSIASISKVKMPFDIVEQQSIVQISELEYDFNTTLEELAHSAGVNTVMYKEYQNYQAKTHILQTIISDIIIQDLNINVTQSDINKKYEEYTTIHQTSVEDVKKHISEEKIIADIKQEELFNYFKKIIVISN